MINVSNDMYRAMQSNTDFKEYLTITLANGTALTIPQGDIVVQGNSLTCGGGTNGVPVGMAVARTIRIEIANFDDKYSDYDFYGARIQVQMKYSYPNSSGTTLTSTIPYGYYTVITPETLGTTIVITAVDDMYKADKPFSSNLPFPGVRADTLLSAVCSSCGISLQTVTFTNGSFTIKEKPTDCTFREVIGGIAMLAGGNAFINREGRLEIKAYDTSMSQELLENDGLYYKPWLQTIQKSGGSFNPWTSGDGDVLDGGTYSSNRLGCHILYAWTNDPAVDTDDITITGLAIDTDRENRVLYGTEGYVLTVTNPCVVGKESDAVAVAGPLIVGLKFRAFSGTYIGDPTMEFMDDCVVVDRKGNTYSSFITDMTYNFRGTTEVRNAAEPVIRNNASYNGTTKTVQRARRLVEERLSSYDLGIQNLSELMGNSIGFYVTEEPLEDGSKIYYMHDMPTKEQSQIVYKKTINGIAVSNDGGQTWTAGVDNMGNAVMTTIAAKKISADIIDSGKLLVGTNENPVFYADITNNKVFINAKNSNNQQTFYLDSSTGQIDIRANSFTLQGNTIQSIADTSVDGALTLSNVFNKLTNNSTDQGIYLDNGKIFINMSYLNTGVLSVKDNQNVTTFSVDASTGQVVIRPTTITIGGRTVEEIAADAAGDIDLSNYATKAYADEAKKTATNYIYYDSSNGVVISQNGTATGSSDKPFNTQILASGIYLRNRSTDYIQLTTNGLTIRPGGTRRASFTADSLTFYMPNGTTACTYIGANGLDVRSGVIGGFTADSNSLSSSYTYSRVTSTSPKSEYKYVTSINKPTSTSKKVIRFTNERWDEKTYDDDIPVLEPEYEKASELYETFSITYSGGINATGLTVSDPTRGYTYLQIKDTSNNPLSPTYSSSMSIGLITSDSSGTTLGGLRHASTTYTLKLHDFIDLGGGGSGSIGVDTGSSRRYKNHIKNMPYDYAKGILEITPVIFKFKDGYLIEGDECEGKEIPGFYAEDVEEHFPMGVAHTKDGLVENWKPDRVIPVMLRVMQEQQKTTEEQQRRIDSLEERLARLERMVGNV